jgi:exopolyphosphatase/guanosine-5'-triphosphate,3'-diphosphate pyrophosphatase
MLVVDAHPGARPLPAFSHKVDLRLAEHLEPDNTLSTVGEERLTELVVEAMRIAEDKGVEEFMAFATSAVRDADNGDDALVRIQERTGVRIRVLAGEHEARLTFLAARRWFGWSSGRLLVFDIGGGSLEVAVGQDEAPEAVMSLPLGAGRLTRNWFSADPPGPDEVRALRRHVRAEIARHAGEFLRRGPADQAVGTSKTFRQLARIGGAAASSEGLYAKRSLKHTDVVMWAERLAAMDRTERARLPGVSEGRAPQLVAGAIVADAAMDLMEATQLEICPWALREGVILRRLDMLAQGSALQGSGLHG